MRRHEKGMSCGVAGLGYFLGSQAQDTDRSLIGDMEPQNKAEGG